MTLVKVHLENRGSFLKNVAMFLVATHGHSLGVFFGQLRIRVLIRLRRILALMERCPMSGLEFSWISLLSFNTMLVLCFLHT